MDFIRIRDPYPDELKPGFDSVLIGEGKDGSRWILKDEKLDEVYAYAMSEVYFGHIVPETLVIADMGKTAQRIVRGKTAHELSDVLYSKIRESVTLIKDLAHLVCLDYIMNNSDRHGNNWIITDSGRIVAIDNSLGEEYLPLRQALRPAWRSGMVDDPDFTPILIDEIKLGLYAFSQLVPEGDSILPRRDIAEWERELRQIHSI